LKGLNFNVHKLPATQKGPDESEIEAPDEDSDEDQKQGN
jgi:hypothetical protein